MCGTKLKHGISSAELRNRLDINSISNCMREMQLRWFGHVERANDENWLCRNLIASWIVKKERLHKRLEPNIMEDLQKLKLDKTHALDHAAWKAAIKKPPSSPF